MPLKLRLITLLLRTIALTPLTAQRWLGRLIGNAMLRWDKRSARICRQNVSLCFPELNTRQQESLCRQSLQHTGMAFSELGACYYWSPEKLKAVVRCDDLEILHEAIAEEKGVIFASPHFGNWELIGQYVGINYKMHVLYRPAKDPDTDNYILERRSRLGVSLLPTNAGGVRGLSKALKQGDIIGILPDQEPDLEGGIFAPFFGQQALTMTLLSKLAKRKQTPVLLTYMRRTKKGFALHFDRLDDAIYDADLHKSATALNTSIEELVRKHPEQYIWNYKRFATQPEGSKRLY